MLNIIITIITMLLVLVLEAFTKIETDKTNHVCDEIDRKFLEISPDLVAITINLHLNNKLLQLMSLFSDVEETLSLKSCFITSTASSFVSLHTTEPSS